MDIIAVVDKAKCIGCASCEMVCPVEAIRVGEDFKAWANEKCIACGACCAVCPTQCITMEAIDVWKTKVAEELSKHKK